MSSFRTVLSAIHMQVTDRPSPDAPSLTQAIIVHMVNWSTPRYYVIKFLRIPAMFTSASPQIPNTYNTASVSTHAKMAERAQEHLSGFSALARVGTVELTARLVSLLGSTIWLKVWFLDVRADITEFCSFLHFVCVCVCVCLCMYVCV